MSEPGERASARCTTTTGWWYAKTPLGGPAQVREYLSRYTHRTAIGNQRWRAITPTEVAFTVRADDPGGKRLMRLPGQEFVARLLLHVLPTGSTCIRHYGVLAFAMQGCQAEGGTPGLEHATAKPADHLLRWQRVHQRRSMARRSQKKLPLLQEDRQ